MAIPFESILDLLDGSIDKCIDHPTNVKINEILSHHNCSYMVRHEDTMLIFACRNGDHEMVRELFNLNANPNCEGPLSTPLFEAVNNNHNVVVDMLLEKSVDINKKHIWSGGYNALHFACKNNNYKIVKKLCDANINVNELTNSGTTPLHIASAYADTKIIEYLVDKGAFTDIQNNYGETPLFFASRYGAPENIQKLLSYGCDPNIKNKDGLSPATCTDTEIVKNFNSSGIVKKFMSYIFTSSC